MGKEMELYSYLDQLLTTTDLEHPEKYQMISEEEASLDAKNEDYVKSLMLLGIVDIKELLQKSIDKDYALNRKLLYVFIVELRIDSDKQGKELFSNIIYLVKQPEAQSHLMGYIANMFSTKCPVEGR